MYIKARTPVEAWKRLVKGIMEKGMMRVDERESKTLWRDNVMIHISHPFEERVSDLYPFSETILREKYATQLLNPDRMDFEYTYGERLRAWGSETLDQIEYVVEKLKESRHTRRAVATTWDPRKDTVTDEVPCLNHFVFMEREGHIDISVMIRSNDMYGAWPANVYALSELLLFVAKETGLDPGTITTLSVNAHIYEHDWENAQQV